MMKSRINKLSALLLSGFYLTGLQAQTVKDIDGNVYKTVTIGTQTWMAKNLKTTKLNDGIPIPLVRDSISWPVLTTPAYCWYNNDEKVNKNIYGALYNWHTVNTGKLCPSGWHVPSDDEWKILFAYLGGADAGDKLQEKGTTHWVNPNPGATNESGFTALPGGLRIKSGTFVALGLSSYWWCSTEDKPEARYVGYYDSGVERGSNSKQFGLSVRCISGAAGSITTSNITALAATPVVITKNDEHQLTAGEQKPMELVIIRNESFRFEVTTPKSWSFSKMVQQDPYEEMKSGKYSSSLSTGDGDKVPENWNGFRLNSTGPDYDACPFLIIYAHKVADQKPEDFAKLFELSLTRFGIKDLNLNRKFSVGDATGFDCIYDLGLKVRYTTLYSNGIRVVIHYYFPSNDPALFDRYASEIDKIIKSLRIK
jgi:uncharacterized protein (TIGR02145 family)